MRRTTIVATLTLGATLACSFAPRNIRTLTAPSSSATVDARSPYLKAHMRNGDVYVLSGWEIDESARTVTGQGDLRGVDRKLRESGRFTVPIDSVALFEANVVPKSEAMRAVTVVTGISAAVTLGCLVMPKSCFGSCPTFYTADGTAEHLQAEGFSTSIAPSLEATDIDALYRSRPEGRRFEVRMRNEALETHVVRHAHLLAVPRPPGGRVVATGAGVFHEALELRAPRACTAGGGACLAAVSALDGLERTSATNGENLAARETVDLEFDGIRDGRVGLVIGARQTLLTTYLFYQTLAYMGPTAGAWMAQFERTGPILEDRAHAVRDLLGGIEVLVQGGDGAWAPAGEVHETGPLAADVKLVPLPAGADTRRIRLRLTRGHWRLDFLALARLGATLEPVRLQPVGVERDGGPAEEFRSWPLTTLPGDGYRFTYQLPEDPSAYELFLESRGYYLEWLREQWLAEESPERLMKILWDPRQALIDLAPEYTKQEAAGEKAFWSSRYVRH